MPSNKIREDTTDAIECRLAKIESQVRSQRRIITLLVILLVAGISYGAITPIPEVIQARRFEVVNGDGKVVVELESWELGGKITTLSAKGLYRPSIALTHTDDGQGLLLVYNKDGKKLIYAGGGESGDGLLLVYTKDGKHLIYAGANKSGDGLLKVKSKNGNDRVAISGGLTGGGGISVLNKTGEEVVQIHADDYGMGYVGAFDRQGKGKVLQPR